MVGGAVGALLGSIFHIGATSYGVTGLPGFLITMDYTVQYAIILAVSFLISFALTWVIWKEEGDEPEKASEASENSGASSQEIPVVLPEKIEEKTLYAPVKGNVIARDQIPDETFASGVLGDGVGIEPEVGLVVAPCDGEIASLTDSRHAIGIVGAGGMEILIHVGIDTVNMQGDGFELLVSMGEKVKAGQKLLHFDLEKIKAAGYNTTTAVLVANSFMFPGFQVERTGKTELMEKLISTE